MTREARTPWPGFVERALLADIDGEPGEELVVLVRSAGSGNYLTVLAYRLDAGGIELLAREDDITPGDDPLQRLRK